MTKTLTARFAEKVALPNADGCMLWLGALDLPGGYGRFRVGTKTDMAHRVSYELHVGPIPDDLPLDHLCRVRHCVAPDHLEPVSMRVNTLRGDTIPAANAAKTHCPADHPYSPENTRITKSGRRRCRICDRASFRDWYRRNPKGSR